jgi:hypothetical protein
MGVAEIVRCLNVNISNLTSYNMQKINIKLIIDMFQSTFYFKLNIIIHNIENYIYVRFLLYLSYRWIVTSAIMQRNTHLRTLNCFEERLELENVCQQKRIFYPTFHVSILAEYLVRIPGEAPRLTCEYGDIVGLDFYKIEAIVIHQCSFLT